MKIISFWLLLILISYQVKGQDNKRDNIWMLGSASAPGYPQFGINFNAGSADTFSLLRPMAFFLTNASICDTNGQLLFYTNGNYVSNRKHEMMLGTSGFNPGNENTDTYPFGSGIVQGAMILPWPNRKDRYMILHMSGDYFTIGPSLYERALSLRFSEIDMLLDSGYGGFTNLKNKILIEDTLVTSRITACKHANGRDWWICAHELWSDRFYEFLLTPDTIQLYQTQNIGSIITHHMDALGTGVFSQNGEQFAYLNGDTTLNIFNFNRCTGEFSNPVYVYFLDTLNLGTLSCAFSPSGRYLYVINNFHVFQLDVEASDIPASKIIVATYDNFITSQGAHTKFFLMKLAPDNKIYISTNQGSDIFHVINAPDSAGLGCRVTQHSFQLPDYNAFSMPNVPNYSLGPLSGSVCDSLHIGINEIEKNNLFILYPNPSNEKVSFRFNEDIHFQKGEFRIFNSLGAIVVSHTIHNKGELIDMDVHSLSNGIYSCRLIFNNTEYLVGKLSIIH